jgi:hypothetical protein
MFLIITTGEAYCLADPAGVFLVANSIKAYETRSTH